MVVGAAPGFPGLRAVYRLRELRDHQLQLRWPALLSKSPAPVILSPMFSPLLTREVPAWWPSFAPFFGTMLILWAPLGFRFTCYYYRGAYYKAWWADPISCAVGEPRKTYWGERKWPLLIQNVAPLFSVLRDHLHLHPGLRRLEGTVVRRPQRSRHAVRYRRRFAGHDPEPDPAGTVHVRVPFIPPSDRRAQRRAVRPVRCGSRVTTAYPASIANTCCGPGSACSTWALWICTSACARWASGRTGGSSKWRTIRFTNTTSW